MKKIFAVLLTAALLMTMTAGFALAEGYVYLNDTANVRTGPGAGYKKLATLREGSTVDYMQQKLYDSLGNAWYRVTVGTGNVIGWVLGDYVSLTNVPGHAIYSDGANAGGGVINEYNGLWDVNRVIATGRVNVRKGAGLQYEIVKTMGKDDKAEYLGDIKYDERGVMWYHVKYEGKTGWVSSTYAELENSQLDQYKWVEIAGGKCNVRKGPGLAYKSVGTAYEHDILTYMGNSVLDERGVAWYRVVFEDGDGWVSSTYSKLF